MADQEHGQHVDAGQLGEDVRQLGHGAEQIEVPPPLIHVGNECFQYQAGLCKVEPPGHEPDVDIPFNVPQNVPSQCASVPPPLICIPVPLPKEGIESWEINGKLDKAIKAVSQGDNVECDYGEESFESKQESNLEKFVTEEDSHEEEDLGEVLILKK
ncbi:hypothetical protein DAPPUDRAFT_331189, partial [Daphnia pulex]